MTPTAEKILRDQGIDPITCRQSEFSPNVLYTVVPGDRAISIWQSLRASFTETGLWPILRGDASEDLDEYEYNAADLLAKVPDGTPDELLQERLVKRIEGFGEFVDNLTPGMNATAFVEKVDASGAMSFGGTPPVKEPWPTQPIEKELSVHSISNHRDGKPRPRVRLALISLKDPWEAPAYLGFGGWNDAPGPEVQVAMLREWNRANGALPIAITGDVLECFVERPPQTEAEAKKLAIQQWLFCDDIVSQGTQTVRRLAVEIWRSPRWFFWWD